MSASTNTPLGASTLNRKWVLDVDTTPASSATWVRVQGMGEFQPTRDHDLQEDSDFDSDGFKSSTKTAEAWGATFKVMRKVKVSDGTAYDTAQEWLRTHSEGQMGAANSVHIRYYEETDNGPTVQAYEGNAAVAWVEDGGNMPGLSTATVTLTGQGKLSTITNPVTA